MGSVRALRLRFRADSVPTRLGGIAANLGRIASLSQNEGHQQVITAVLDESLLFSEWATDESESALFAELAALRAQLSAWRRQAEVHWRDQVWRECLIDDARQWSGRLLALSGLASAGGEDEC